MTTPVPPPWPPRANTATVAGLMRSTTPTRSASDLSTSGGACANAPPIGNHRTATASTCFMAHFSMNRTRQIAARNSGKSTALLADTEPAEHAVEQIIRVDGADDRSQLFQRQPERHRQQLCRFLIQHQPVPFAQLLQASVHMVAATAQTRR